MHTKSFCAAAALVSAATLASGASAELKKVPYAPVKVELAEAYRPDAAFEKMRKAFLDATHNKDTAALSALVAPGFVWNSEGVLAADFDTGRGPLHNFKVLFGFRDFGKNADGGVDGGPFWDTLSTFAEDDSYYKLDQGSGLVCGPMAATVDDENALAQARKKIDTADDEADWYFVLRETKVNKDPSDKGLPVGSLNAQAFPVLSTFPPEREGQPEPVATHYEVLLPSGKSGWIPVAAARPLDANRLCYALTARGDWTIGLYDALPDSDED